MPDTDLRTKDKIATKQSPSSHKVDFLLERCMQYQNPNTHLFKHAASSSGDTKAGRQRHVEDGTEDYRQDGRLAPLVSELHMTVRVDTQDK